MRNAPHKVTGPAWTVVKLMDVEADLLIAIEENLLTECDTCRSKPGAPVLCDHCLKARDLGGELQRLRYGVAPEVEG